VINGRNESMIDNRSQQQQQHHHQQQRITPSEQRRLFDFPFITLLRIQI